MSAVLGRCVPAIFADIADVIGDVIKTTDGDEVVDKFNNTVNGTVLQEATRSVSAGPNEVEAVGITNTGCVKFDEIVKSIDATQNFRRKC